MPLILITGVSSGLGNALARRAHAAGWEVAGTVRAEPDPRRYGLPDEMRLFVLDLADESAVRPFAERVTAEVGLPDVLVNNAGFTVYAPLEETPPAEVRQAFQVNTFAAVELACAFASGMRERGSGVIANVSSIGGRFVFPFFATYNASKHALEGFSEGLWHELKPFGVRVKVIEPGYIETPIYRSMTERAEPTGPYARYVAAMNAFAASVSRRTSPEAAAEEAWKAITDPSDRLRYPVAAYARPLLAAHRLLGAERFMRVMHTRWMGPGS